MAGWGSRRKTGEVVAALIGACVLSLSGALGPAHFPHAAAAPPPDTVITFDDLSAGTVVTSQYRSQGVSFQDNSAPSIVADFESGVSRSRPNAAKLPVARGCELEAPATTGFFVVPHRRVAAWVATRSQGTISLTGYDSQGKPVAKATDSKSTGDFTLLAISSGSPTITSFVITTTAACASVVFDDLSFDVATATLTVLAPTGGRVTGPGINCPGDCTEEYGQDTQVSLTATPDPGSTAATWGGDCASTGTTPTCTLTMNADKSVSATFPSPKQTLNVAVTGSGKVAGQGIACPGDCSEQYPAGSSVTLTGTPDPGFGLNWGGDCAGVTASTCTVKLDAARSVTATFVRSPQTLNVAVTGSGTIAGQGINCPGDCSEQYPAGTKVTVTAATDAAHKLTGWGGDCASAGTAPTCTVTMDGTRSVTATFEVTSGPTSTDPQTLTVTVNGGGKVTGQGISCPGTCSAQYKAGTSVTLAAAPDPGSAPVTWGGDCASAGKSSTCTVKLDAARAVTAAFTRPATLKLQVGGAGKGTVSGTGIDCPNDCSDQYQGASDVVLTAASVFGSSFVGWGGDCASAGFALTCTLRLDRDKSVTATFKKDAVIDQGLPRGKDNISVATNVGVSVVGDGVVVSSDSVPPRALASARGREPLIACGLDRFSCFARFDARFLGNETVTLTARPARGYVFKSWAGACSGAGPRCTVRADAVSSVTAIFVARNPASVASIAIAPPHFRVSWRRSVGTGQLVVGGRIARSAQLRIQMRRTHGGPLLTRRVTVAGGQFDQRATVRAGLLSHGAIVLPGGFVVTLIGKAGGLSVPQQIQTAVLPAPREGVVQKAFVSPAQKGRPVTRLSARTKEAWATFVLARAAQPKAGMPVSVTWYTPTRRLGTVIKANTPVVSSFIRSDVGLESGLWVAELRAGGRIVQRLAVRIKH